MERPLLLFDLDGTLVDSAQDIARALSEVRRQRGGGAITPAVVRPLVSLGAETLVREGLGEFGTTPSADLALFRQILGQLAPDPASVFDGVPAALGRLQAAGYPMAIVTNKPEGLSIAVLQALGLARFFPVIVGGDTASMCKPDPAPVRHALTAMRATADCALFIGDSAVDASAARACAIPFLLFEGGYGAVGCAAADVWARFVRFEELADVVARASAAIIDAPIAANANAA